MFYHRDHLGRVFYVRNNTMQVLENPTVWRIDRPANKIQKAITQTKILASQKIQWRSATHRGCLSHQDTWSSQLGQPGQLVQRGQRGQWKLKQKTSIGFGFGLVSPLYFWGPTKKCFYQNSFTKYHFHFTDHPSNVIYHLVLVSLCCLVFCLILLGRRLLHSAEEEPTGGAEASAKHPLVKVKNEFWSNYYRYFGLLFGKSRKSKNYWCGGLHLQW